MDAYILSLETSSRLCEAALLSCVDGRVEVRALTQDAVGEHAERLLPMADQLLAQAGLGRDSLDAVAFGRGPGGFTGLRVACGVAQGIGYALGIPVLPVVSLLAAAARDAQAQGAVPDPAQEPVRVLVQDARMEEVYLGAYRYTPAVDAAAGQWQVLQAPILMGVADVGPWLRSMRGDWRDASGRLLPVRMLGDALDAYAPLRDLVADGAAGLEDVQLGAALRPTAEAIARLALVDWKLGRAIAPEQASPLYVRDRVAYTTLERAQGLGGNPRAGAFRDLAIETMTSGHLDSVIRIERSVQSFPWTAKNFQDALQAGYGAWVAKRGDAVVGFFLAMHAPDVTHLLLIAVDPDAQRQGVGAFLLRHCEHEAREHGLNRVILEVRLSNQKALAFYGKHGFSVLTMRKDYYPAGRNEREDALVLEKSLDKGARP